MPLSSFLFKTTRCAISKASENDRRDIIQLKTNNIVREFLGGPVPNSQINDKINSILNDEESHHFIVRDRKDESFIGLVTIDTYRDYICDKTPDETPNEISYELTPAKHGQGFATESISAIIRYGFTHLKLKIIVAETQSKNMPSIQLLKKLGMTKEKTIIRHYEEQDVYILRPKNKTKPL